MPVSCEILHLLSNQGRIYRATLFQLNKTFNMKLMNNKSVIGILQFLFIEQTLQLILQITGIAWNIMVYN